MKHIAVIVIGSSAAVLIVLLTVFLVRHFSEKSKYSGFSSRLTDLSQKAGKLQRGSVPASPPSNPKWKGGPCMVDDRGSLALQSSLQQLVASIRRSSMHQSDIDTLASKAEKVLASLTNLVPCSTACSAAGTYSNHKCTVIPPSGKPSCPPLPTPSSFPPTPACNAATPFPDLCKLHAKTSCDKDNAYCERGADKMGTCHGKPYLEHLGCCTSPPQPSPPP